MDILRCLCVHFLNYVSLTNSFDWVWGHRGLAGLNDREVACYTISCKNSTNIDVVIDWLVKHSKTKS